MNRDHQNARMLGTDPFMLFLAVTSRRPERDFWTAFLARERAASNRVAAMLAARWRWCWRRIARALFGRWRDVGLRLWQRCRQRWNHVCQPRCRSCCHILPEAPLRRDV